MLIKLDDEGFTPDRKYRLLPTEPDIDMYYAGAGVQIDRLVKHREIDNKVTPSEAAHVWRVMAANFVSEPSDYAPYK